MGSGAVPVHLEIVVVAIDGPIFLTTVVVGQSAGPGARVIGEREQVQNLQRDRIDQVARDLVAFEWHPAGSVGVAGERVVDRLLRVVGRAYRSLAEVASAQRR